MSGTILFTDNAGASLRKTLGELAPSRTILLYPGLSAELLINSMGAPDITDRAIHIAHPVGEEHKTIATATGIWQQMLEAGADRKSVIVNLGGGLTSDLGGFVASCYMRGIRYVNLPTTLLGAVDAACGGKTGVNLNGVKNIIGAFQLPAATIISPQFLHTLPPSQILSGWAEMLKHALLIGPEALHTHLGADPLSLSDREWLPLIKQSVEFKHSVTEADPCESGLRRILNLGHTAGHAIEALSQSRGKPVTHGHAVAIGTVTALVLSRMLEGFDSDVLYKFAAAVRTLYPTPEITCEDYPALLSLMHHDKKNRGGQYVWFTLLKSPGHPVEAHPTDDDSIRTALDITRDLLGI